MENGSSTGLDHVLEKLEKQQLYVLVDEQRAGTNSLTQKFRPITPEGIRRNQKIKKFYVEPKVFLTVFRDENRVFGIWGVILRGPNNREVEIKTIGR